LELEALIDCILMDVETQWFSSQFSVERPAWPDELLLCWNADQIYVKLGNIPFLALFYSVKEIQPGESATQLSTTQAVVTARIVPSNWD
jgi:hypothetical protein